MKGSTVGVTNELHKTPGASNDNDSVATVATELSPMTRKERFSKLRDRYDNSGDLIGTSVVKEKGRKQYISWSKFVEFEQMARCVNDAKNSIARDAINEAEKLRWILEEEREKHMDETAFLEGEMKKLNSQKSLLKTQVDDLERQVASLKGALDLMNAEIEDRIQRDNAGSPDPRADDKHSKKKDLKLDSILVGKGVQLEFATPEFATPEQLNMKTILSETESHTE
eukprot:jgi/Picsp_1/1208/NSC_04689-R1_---NA---